MFNRRIFLFRISFAIALFVVCGSVFSYITTLGLEYWQRHYGVIVSDGYLAIHWQRLINPQIGWRLSNISNANWCSTCTSCRGDYVLGIGYSRDPWHSHYQIPCWLFSLLGTVVLLIMIRFRPRRQPADCCSRCGYSLVGLVSGKCPECGFEKETTEAREKNTRGMQSNYLAVAAVTLLGIAFVWIAATSFRRTATEQDRNEIDGEIAWQAYDRNRLARDLQEGRIVFVNITADWCEECGDFFIALQKSPLLRQLIMSNRATAYEADYTLKNRQLVSEFQKLSGFDLPLLVVYGPDKPGTPKTLADELSEEKILKVLRSIGVEFETQSD